MTNPLEGTYRLYVWEVGGSDAEPTDTGRTGTMDELMELGMALSLGGAVVDLPDGRKEFGKESLAGYIVKPEVTTDVQ